ncbi:non-hydrolyzing UDP-N-acetylglucosamine 2-epimerase [Estrella lausannensis]|uniref:UDP-N-acetylglucosamine 2-epimerase n=1 Tax=Estrella lausannensis TaxID=483423 RepID=A0A0H5DRF1_9BACT|nr:UDP-N-acetylglucosamine 2-epimerase (non-hydrolyzing) [Estrella lausannensis]CRX38768.1 UDP-N-acetylglucosamine 2-epimerase [Estrella lausannensis]
MRASKIKIATIVGARPQFIKAAMTSLAIEKMKAALPLEEVIIHTGQHFDKNMSDIFFEELSIKKPDYNLGVGGLSASKMTGRMIEALEEPLLIEKPDLVLVFGDTNSTLAGALTASKLLIPCAHVEAGLRSFNRSMPEEINRVAVDHLAEWLFAPTEASLRQLKNEGIDDKRLFLTGDIMADALYHYEKKADEQSSVMTTLGLKKKNYILATVHRQENTDNQSILEEIMEGLASLSSEMEVIMPIHPRSLKLLTQYGLIDSLQRKIRFVNPVGYLDMLALQKNAIAIATDSGGVQKEAYLLKTPCFTLRTETEWVELIKEGFNELVPLSREAIPIAIRRGIGKERDWSKNLYGDGKAAGKIIEILSAKKS